MAEAMFRNLLRRRGLNTAIEVDSAGTGGWHVGEPPHAETLQVLEDHSMSGQGRRARKLSGHEVDDWDYVLVMDQTNLDAVLALRPKVAQVHLLMDFHPNPPTDREVPDPYQTGRFEEVYRLLEPALVELLNHLTRADE